MALDRLAVIFKAGDEPDPEGLAHGDPIRIVDELDYGKAIEDVVTPDAFVISLIVQFNRTAKDFLVDSLQAIGIMPDGSKSALFYRPRKRRLDFKALESAIRNPFLEEDAISKEVSVPLVDAVDIKIESILVDSLLFVPPVKPPNPVDVSVTYQLGHLQKDGRRYVTETHILDNGDKKVIEYLASPGTDYQKVATDRLASMNASAING